jgi:hypothetical protein
MNVCIDSQHTTNLTVDFTLGFTPSFTFSFTPSFTFNFIPSFTLGFTLNFSLDFSVGFTLKITLDCTYSQTTHRLPRRSLNSSIQSAAFAFGTTFTLTKPFTTSTLPLPSSFNKGSFFPALTSPPCAVSM